MEEAIPSKIMKDGVPNAPLDVKGKTGPAQHTFGGIRSFPYVPRSKH